MPESVVASPPSAPVSADADWRAALPEDMRGEPTLANIKGKDWSEAGPVIVKNYLETKKLIGAKTDGMVKIPGKDAPPEEVAAYRKAMGVPDKPDGYTLSFPELPGFTWRPDAAKVWGETMHQAGIPPDRAQALVEAFGQYTANDVAAQRREWKAAQAGLMSQWGEATFRQRADWSEKAVDHFFGADFKTMLEATGYGDHPLFFQGMWKVGQLLQEDGIISGPAGARTTEQAQAEMARMRGDATHPLHAALLSRSHPQHGDAMTAWEELLKQVTAAGAKPAA